MHLTTVCGFLLQTEVYLRASVRTFRWTLLTENLEKNC